MGIIGNSFLNLPRYGHLTFSSPNSFSLSIIGSPLWDGIIEYSVNCCVWNIWDGLTTINAGLLNGQYVLFVRGKNNTYITGSQGATDNGAWHFTGSDINVAGIIHNLLDYHGNTNPVNNAFKNLFGWKSPGDTAIVSAENLIIPDPLSDSCCFAMFSRCKGLQVPPKFTAQNLFDSCFLSTFYECSGLIKLPALPALTLATKCYQSMFNSCSNIKLSSTKTGEYQYEYRIPTSGTGTDATDATAGMFSSTGGTYGMGYNTTIPINTVLYTSNEVVYW